MRATHPGPRSTGLAVAILIVLLGHFATGPLLRPLVRPYNYSDFATFYAASRCFSAHTDPYDTAELRATGNPSFEGWIGRYFYPPPFAAVTIRPLAALQFDVARRLWVVCEAAAYCAALVLLAHALPVVWGVWRLVALAALGLPFAPFGLDLKLGSVSGVLLLLMALFMHLRRKGRVHLAALVLGGAVLLKLTPVFVLAYLALRGEMRSAGRAALYGLLLALLALPWSGIQAWIDYATRVVPFLLGANFSWFTNQSADAFWWRLFVPNPDTTPWIASWLVYRVASMTTNLALLGGLVLVALRARRRIVLQTSDAEIGLVLITSLLVARVTWEYMLVLALPCFRTWIEWIEMGRVERRTALVCGAAFALVALPLPYTQVPLRAGVGLLLESPRTYGLLIVYGLTLWQLVRQKAPQDAGLSTQ